MQKIKIIQHIFLEKPTFCKKVLHTLLCLIVGGGRCQIANFEKKPQVHLIIIRE